jgi:hypothetical protein
LLQIILTGNSGGCLTDAVDRWKEKSDGHDDDQDDDRNANATRHF